MGLVWGAIHEYVADLRNKVEHVLEVFRMRFAAAFDVDLAGESSMVVIRSKAYIPACPVFAQALLSVVPDAYLVV